MVLASDSGGTGGGAGGTTGYSPTQQKSDDTFNSVVDKVAKSVGTPSAAKQAQKDPPVYLGGKYAVGSQDYYDMQRRGHSNDNILTTSQAEGMYFNFSQKERDKFLSQLQLAGYDVGTLNDYKLSQLWAGYVAQAAGYYSVGKKVTPWDVIAKDRQQREAYAAQPRTVTQTQSSLDLSSRTDASAMFEQAAQSLLGRNPTKSESASFYKALNAYEKANPAITTTTATYKGSDLLSQSSVTKGGVSEGARSYLAEQQAKADPEYGAYQAATTYMGALMQAIGMK